MKKEMEVLGMDIPSDVIDTAIQKCLFDLKFLDLWLFPLTND